MVLKIFAAIAVLLVVLVAALLAYATTRPDTFRVARKTNIKAPPEQIFALIDDFHRWDLWSPWEKMDPTMKRTFMGAPNGTGAIYEWEGSGKVGAGRMEIVDVTQPSKVRIKLDFAKPFEAHNIVEFTLVPDGDSTDVTWSMHGPSPFIAKVMGLVFSMDKMVGKDFETGLANLKTAAVS